MCTFHLLFHLPGIWHKEYMTLYNSLLLQTYHVILINICSLYTSSMPHYINHYSFCSDSPVLWYTKLIIKWTETLQQHHCWEHCHLHL